MTGASEAKKVPNKFGMLLKNDFLASARMVPFIYLALAACFGAYYYGKLKEKTTMTNLSMVGVELVSIILIAVTFVYVVYDFNKSLYGPQGYLSFSLPVSARQLLGSKAIIYGMWMSVSFIVWFVVTDFVSVNAVTALEDVAGEGTVSVFSELLNLPSKTQMVVYVVCMALTVFAVIFAGIFMVYFALTASQMRPFQSHNIIWAVVLFVAECIVDGIIINVVSSILDALENVKIFLRIYFVCDADGKMGLFAGSLSDLYKTDMGSGIYFEMTTMLCFILFCVGLYFLTAHIMHKYVNIK